MRAELYQSFKIKIKPLTPVHIASGTFLIENRDFYVDKMMIHRVYYPNLIANISEEKLAQTLQQIKNEGIRGLQPKPRKKAEKPKIEEDWKQALRQKMGMNAAVEEVEEEAEPLELGSLLDDVELYQIPVNFAREDVGGKVQAMAVDSTLHSFLPGSTVKGAIRTALYVDSLVKDPGQLDRLRFTWTTNPTEADYPLDRELAALDRNNMSKDIFRQLMVRDSSYVPIGQNLDFFQLRIMNIVGDEEGEPNRLAWKKGSKRNVPSYREADPIYWEMIKPGTEFRSEIIFDKQPKSTGEETGLEIDMENVIRAVNAFTMQIARHEMAYAQQYQIPYLRDFYQDLLKKCEEAQANGTTAYLPIGSGLPWHAKTVGDLLESSSLDKIRRHFYRYMGKFVDLVRKTTFHGMRLRRGQLSGKQIRPDKLKAVDPFPKTRHYIFIEGEPAYPPGWVCMELQK